MLCVKRSVADASFVSAALSQYLEGHMRRVIVSAVFSAMAIASAACGQQAGTLQASADTLGATGMKSIEYSGSGRWFQFGQAPSPTLPWPQFDVSSFKAAINDDAPSARVEMIRKQTVEPGRVRPAPVAQRPLQVISGNYAWNMAVPPGGQPRIPPVPRDQPAA